MGERNELWQDAVRHGQRVGHEAPVVGRAAGLDAGGSEVERACEDRQGARRRT